MDTNIGNKSPMRLECHVGLDKIIYISMAGNITLSGEGDTENFEHWAKEVNDAMQAIFAKNNGRVLTLTNASQMEHFDLAMTDHLRKLFEANKKFATKTAVFGASKTASAVVHSMMVLTHRTNMEIFTSREEALAWLIAE